ncbi:MAG: KOW motif-containing protein [Victivallales bacterium]|nr:KOW motif-containing protein [Victivallales bacterium]MCF7889196.1 KOW motif-containing protein [Victivallales bacterium]
MRKLHVKAGDEVTVISGKWKGEDAKVKAILNKKDRVVLEMTGLSAEKKKQIGVRTLKKSQQNPNGGIVDRSVSVHISNVKQKESKKAKQ